MITKTLVSSLLRKKARLFLLLFSIAACASLIFSNVSFGQTVKAVVTGKSLHYSGNADISVTVKEAVGAQDFIDIDLLTPYSDQFEYMQSLIKCMALYVNADTQNYFNVLGVDINEFNLRNPLSLESGSFDYFTGNQIIMSTTFANKLNVSAGDKLPLEINGALRDFTIAGISQPSGLFSRDVADGGFLLMPHGTAGSFTDEKYNLVFIKLKNTEKAVEFRQLLAEAIPQYNVKLCYDKTVVNAEVTSFSMPFWLSSILVVFMSVFIIYSSFNLIVNERIKIIGILRSVGCSRRKTNNILLAESAVIGLIGGLFGCVLGVGVLYLIKTMFYGGDADVEEAKMIFGLNEVILTLVVSVVLTTLSAMLPIFRIAKLSMKKIILGDYQKEKLKANEHWILGLVLHIPVIIIPFVVGQNFVGMIIASTAFLLALIGMNLVIPVICRFVSQIFAYAPQEIMLGVRNAGDFKALLNNTRLFATTIAIMVLMTALFNSMGSDLRKYFQREPFDIQLEMRESDVKTLAALSKVDGVESVYGIYSAYLSVLPDYDSYFNEVIGLSGADYFDFYYAKEVSEETKTALNNLKDNEMVTTYIMRDKLGLKLGDVIRVQHETGDFEYKIRGFVDTNRDIGHMGFISAETYKDDLTANNYRYIAVKADSNSSPETVKSNILRQFSKDVLLINTKQELEAANADKVLGVFNAINTYAYLAMIIAILGIINNVAACFMNRQRNIAMYRCIGMSRKGAGRMLMTESVTIGAIGLLAGLAEGILLTGVIPLLVGLFWGNVTVAVPAMKVTVICAAGISAMILCSLIPLVKGRNISIMDNIRYE